MLARLKAECGSQFTAKLDGMLKDLALSDATAQHYRDHCAAVARAGEGEGVTAVDKTGSSSGSGGGSSCGAEVELNAKVLTVGFWPATPAVELLHLPPSLLAAQQRFEAFYAKHYQGRRLAWAHLLGSCVLRAQFPQGGRKELDCPFFMALCLLAFNGPTNATLPMVNRSAAVAGPVAGSDEGGGEGDEGGSADSGLDVATVRRTLDEVRRSSRLEFSVHWLVYCSVISIASNQFTE